MQALSLLHCFSFSYFPSAFLAVTAPLTVVNLDIVSLSQGEKWQEYEGVAGWLPLFTMLLCLVPVLLAYVDWRLDAVKYSHPNGRGVLMTFRYFRVAVLDFLLVPVMLSTSRLWRCADQKMVESVTWEIQWDYFRGLEADPSVECFGAKYTMLVASTSLLTMAFMGGYLAFHARAAASYSPYPSALDHMKVLATYEIGHVLSLTEEYVNGAWLICSFKHRGRYWRSFSVAFRVLMLAPFCASLSPQLVAAAAWFLCLFYFASAILLRPFRSPSSNLLNAVAAFGLLLNCVMLVFTVQGIRSSFTLPSRSFVYLTAINGLCILVFLGICALFGRGEIWPAYRVLERIPDVVKHVECIKATRATLLRCQSAPLSVAPLHDLETDMRHLRNSLLGLLKKKR